MAQWLPDAECDRLFDAAAKLPPHRRVKERLRLCTHATALQPRTSAVLSDWTSVWTIARCSDWSRVLGRPLVWAVREQPHLREAVERRCVEHKLSMQAALEIDFVARNAGPSNFTREAEEKRKRRQDAQRAIRERRTLRARELKANNEVPKEAISSDRMTEVRGWRRLKDLSRVRARKGSNEPRTSAAL